MLVLNNDLHHKKKTSCESCSTEPLSEIRFTKSKEIKKILFSAIILAVGLVLEFILNLHLIAQFVFIIVVLLGYELIKDGFYFAIFKRRLTINFLMTIAAIGAFVIGHGEEGAAVFFLFSIAEYLEKWAEERARRSIEALIRIAPDVAIVKRDGKEAQVNVKDVKVGEIVLVKPGARIPLDGFVIKGVSSVDQAPITGESIPVLKQVGDEVYAGTINNEGFLEIKTTKKTEDTIISKIVKLVEEARAKRSPIENFVDKFSKYYTPTVILLAICLATIPTLLFNLPFYEWFYKALVLLVVACPCALVISTPVAMVSAITSGAKNGVLIKGSNYVEEVGKSKVFAFDKTGTLTEGKPEVTDLISFTNSEKELLVIAASLEKLSEHPLARAIIERAKEEGVKLKDVTEFKAIAGMGIKGKIDGKMYYIGSPKLFNDSHIEILSKKTEDLEEEGKTVIVVGDEKEIMGLIALNDKVRKDTIRSIKELQDKGIDTVMITGDNERTAKAIADKIGIKRYYARLMPQDKVRIVNELKERYKHVVMVGDGVNDAPALASASVGIAMGAIGSDVSLETADIALMQDDLSKLPYLVELSRKTMKIVKENIVSSIGVKGTLAILTFPGFVSLWLAVAVGDIGLSLLVIFNAIRLSFISSH